MDPNATLRMLLDALRDGDREQASEMLGNLADWIGNGGFLPADPRPASAPKPLAIMTAIVRRAIDDSHEFILASEMAADYQTAIAREEINARDIPQWHAANKVVRVVRVAVTEQRD